MLYPRGNALTDTMPFTDRDEVHWIVYIEGVEPDPSSRRWGQTVLPGRRLRFDSATASRTSIQVPAGSPYLPDPRLQSLLDQAQSLPAGLESPAAVTGVRLPLAGKSRARRKQPSTAAAGALRRLWTWGWDRGPRLVRRLGQFVATILAVVQKGAMRSGLRRARR